VSIAGFGQHLHAHLRHGSGKRHERNEKAADAGNTLRRLGSVLAPHYLKITAASFGVLIAAGASISAPWLFGKAVDTAVLARDVPLLRRFAAVITAVYCINWAGRFFSARIMAYVSQHTIQELRDRLFSRLQMLPVSFFGSRQHGEIISRLVNDLESINQLLSQNLTELAANSVQMTGILCVMFFMNVPLACTALALLPAFIITARYAGRYTRNRFSVRQRELGAMHAFSEEQLSGLTAITAFGQSGRITDLFREHNGRFVKASIRAQTMARFMMPLTNIASHCTVALVALIGGIMAVDGIITLGIFTSFVMYTQRFMQPLREIGELYNTFQTTLAGTERVFELMDEPDEGIETPGIVFPYVTDKGMDIVFENAGFSYEPGVPVLNNISFRAEAGKMTALIGPTGAGKTTVVNLLLRFNEIQDGVITIGGCNIQSMQKSALRRLFGAVLQDTFLFTESVIENIRFGRLEASDEAVIDAACRAQADYFIRQLPEGYHTVLSENGRNLSQGQRQLLAIARLMLADPKIILLDEATSSIDTHTERLVQKAITGLLSGRTSIVIAHRLSTIRSADNVIVLENGRVAG